MNKKIFNIALLFSLLLGASSCGGGDAEDDDKKKGTEKKVVSNDNTEDDTNEDGDFDEDVSMEDEISLPTALQVAQMMSKEGLGYNEGLTNSPDNSSDYSSEIDKKLNFGVYSADLAYLVINEKYGEAQSYMKVVRELGADTGLDKIFNSEDLLKRFEANQSNRDSLIEVLMDINWRTEEIFEENPDAKKESLIHFAGAWIEGMYIGSQSAQENGDKELGMTVVEQMNVLSSIVKGLDRIAQDKGSDELNELLANLKEILDSYNNLPTVKASAESDLGNYEIPQLNTEELTKLTEQIAKLRNSIVTA